MIEDLLKALILGVVQGLTEFLPVSSTGHLILAQDLLDVDEDTYGLAFDASLHMGTLVALIAYFGRRWLTLIGAGIASARERSFADPEGRLAWLIVAGTIPAAALGLLFEDQIDGTLRSPWLVATMLLIFSAVFVVAETLGKRLREIADLRWLDAAFVGFAQAIALVPGVSRSGATISAGLLRDLKRPEAATFAFLLSAPIIAGAGSLQTARVLGRLIDGTYGFDEAAFFATGVAAAAVSGYLAIAFLLRYLVTNTLMIFVVYRVALALLIFTVLIVQSTN
jgi:undecaprenyl-diphosphatase